MTIELPEMVVQQYGENEGRWRNNNAKMMTEKETKY